MKQNEIVAVLAAIVLIFIISVSAVPLDNPVQPVWGNFEPVPIDLHTLGVYDAQPGDIVYSIYGVAYVAIDSRWALYLDFNVKPVGQVKVNEEPLVDSYSNPYVGAPIEYPPSAYYHVVGQVDDLIMHIIKSPGNSQRDLIDKQFKIWAYLGVDYEALHIVWLKAYGRTEIEWVAIQGKLPFIDKCETQPFSKCIAGVRTTVFESRLSLRYTPHGYTSMTIDAFNSGAHNLALNIQLGTKFANVGGSNQDLGAGEPVTAYIPAGQSRVFELKTYCLNAHKGVPAMDDALNPVGVVPDNVKETMEQAFAAGTASTGESQSAVWQQTG